MNLNEQNGAEPMSFSDDDFWEKWENVTELERRAIDTVKKARKMLLYAVPDGALVAIYLKGSFVRREMKEGSDVDIVPIVTENEYEGDAFGVNCPEIEPAMVVPLSLSELQQNELSTPSDIVPDLRAKPDRFLTHLGSCRLIFGKPLELSKFKIRDNGTALLDEVKVIRDGYIPAFQNGKIDFLPLLKEVFWMTELEQQKKGFEFDHSFEGIAGSVKDPEHIIHEAQELRKAQKEDPERIKRFIKRLLDQLDRCE